MSLQELEARAKAAKDAGELKVILAECFGLYLKMRRDVPDLAPPPEGLVEETCFILGYN